MSKARNLGILRDAGFRVPDFVVVPASTFEHFRRGLPGPCTEELVRAADMPEPLADEILRQARRLPAGPVAVRSSMQAEDSAEHSFAGQLESFLNVPNDADLPTVVRACWASAYGPRARAYRRQHGLKDAAGMEVIIQRMVPAQVSGVLFTVDPVSRDPDWMMVSAVDGLGEALVQGAAEGETWRIDRTDRIEGSGALLNASQLLELAAAARRIEGLFGAPQDIEFARADGEFHFLQARPITTAITAPAAPHADEHLLWDNSNITESYSGVTTPLTYSVIREAYAQVYRQFLGVMGVRAVDETLLRSLLGFYQGQVYYQMLNWYRALALLPAFEHNRGFMEQMMGVKQPAGIETRRGAGGLLALAAWLVRMLVLHATIQRRVEKFLAGFGTVLAEYRDRDLNESTPRQLHAAYLDLNRRVLGQWQAPILTDFFGMITFGLLRRLSGGWIEPGTSLHNDLLAGDDSIESLEPLRRIDALAGMVRADPDLRAAFTAEPGEILRRVRDRARFAAFRVALDDYLLRYGDRCMNELKLEQPNLRDDPARLIRMVAAAVDRPAAPQRAGAVRATAERRLNALPLHRRLVFDWVLRNARLHIRNRENMRFARTRLFGLVRRLVNSVGAQWHAAGVLERADDIYYLTIGEIWDFAGGTAVTQDLRGLTALRRAEFAAHRSRSVPDRFETFGVPYLSEVVDLLAAQDGDPDLLRGTGCCSGQVRARARLIRSADETADLGGDILVAERTDPGWVFLFPSASGILVERGSPLSHSAIVARELGLPAIVNIPGLTRRVQTGDRIAMDGERGTARVVRT